MSVHDILLAIRDFKIFAHGRSLDLKLLRRDIRVLAPRQRRPANSRPDLAAGYVGLAGAGVGRAEATLP